MILTAAFLGIGSLALLALAIWRTPKHRRSDALLGGIAVLAAIPAWTLGDRALSVGLVTFAIVVWTLGEVLELKRSGRNPHGCCDCDHKENRDA